MKRIAFLSMIFVFIFLFATISITQAYRPGRGGGNRPDRGMCREPMPGKFDKCIGELGLSSDQISEFRKLRETHMGNMEQIREGMHTYKVQVRKAIQNGTDVDDDLLNQGSELWKERERERVRYRRQLSNLLTQEQKDKLYMCQNFRSRAKGYFPQGDPAPPEE